MASILLVKGRWRAQIRRAGQRSMARTFDTKREAQAWARGMDHQADRGRMIGGGRTKIRRLLQEYREARKDGGRPIARHSNLHYMLAKLDAWFGDFQVDRLDVGVIRDYARARRRAGAGAYTVYMELSAFGTALRYACSLLGIAYHDPIASARPTLHHLGLIKSQGNRRERRPNSDEWIALLAKLEKVSENVPMIDIVTVAAQIALRRGEICRILWTDLDVSSRTIVVRQRKHPRQKETNDEVVPLVGASLDIIMRQPRPQEGAPDQRIFPFHPQTVSNLFTEARRAAKLDNLVLHDMRHEATSRLFDAGWDIPAVAAVTGHKDWRHLKRYTQLDPAKIAKRQT
jgi:integrase